VPEGPPAAQVLWTRIECRGADGTGCAGLRVGLSRGGGNTKLEAEIVNASLSQRMLGRSRCPCAPRPPDPVRRPALMRARGARRSHGVVRAFPASILTPEYEQVGWHACVAVVPAEGGGSAPRAPRPRVPRPPPRGS
jgi:hypothetical protein